MAKEQFEAAAKALWLETLALAKALRPHGKWGWYNFAHCMSGCSMLPLPHTTADSDAAAVAPLGSCKPAATPEADYNTRMMWLYTEVGLTMLYFNCVAIHLQLRCVASRSRRCSLRFTSHVRRPPTTHRAFPSGAPLPHPPASGTAA